MVSILFNLEHPSLDTRVDFDAALDHHQQLLDVFREQEREVVVTVVSGYGHFGLARRAPPNTFVYWGSLNRFIQAANDPHHKKAIKQVCINPAIWRQPMPPTPQQLADVVGSLSSDLKMQFQVFKPCSLHHCSPFLALLANRAPLYLKSLYLNFDGRKGGVVQFGNALAANRGLEAVSIGIAAQSPVFPLVLESLIDLPALRVLYMFDFFDHEDIDPSILQQMQRLLGRPNLKILNAPAVYLGRAKCTTTSAVKHLHLESSPNVCALKAEYLKSLVRNTTALLSLVVVHQHHFESLEELGPFIEALKNNSSIQTLRLEGAHFGSCIRQAFVAMIKENQAITFFVWGAPTMESNPETNLMIYNTRLNFLKKHKMWSSDSASPQARTDIVGLLLNGHFEWNSYNRYPWMAKGLYEEGMSEASLQLSFAFEFLSSNLWWASLAARSWKRKQTRGLDGLYKMGTSGKRLRQGG